MIVIGAGASGMMAAINAKEAGHDVRILERMNKIGKKILATGNGKCNLTNTKIDETSFRSTNKAFPYTSLKKFGVDMTMKFFDDLGMPLRDKNGYIYPHSEQAVTVVDILQSKLHHLSIPIDVDTEVTKLQKSKHGFSIQTSNGEYKADICVLATGGKAHMELGSNGSGYKLAKQLGHSIIPTVPALTALIASKGIFKEWAGIRVQGEVTIFTDGKQLAKAAGEVQLTNYGISGIPTFEVSRFAARALLEGKQVTANLNFMPDHTREEMLSHLTSIIHRCSYKNIQGVLQGMFHKKLVGGLIERMNFNPYMPASSMDRQDIEKAVDIIQNYQIKIDGTNPFEQAQVTCGGVSTKEVNPETMESKIVSGLYLTGELLDVDGTCGGYNLQWAWTTGRLAGVNIQ